MALQDLASATTGNDFADPDPWKPSHAQVCRENFEEIETRLQGVETLTVTGLAPLLKTTVTLNNNDIKALPTTPKTIIAAPGANTRISVVRLELFANFIAGYTNLYTVDASIWWSIGNGYSSSLANYITNGLSDLSEFLGPIGKQVAIIPEATPTSAIWGGVASTLDGTGQINAALTLNMDNGSLGALTGGNASNAIKVRVLYMLETD